MSFTDRPDYKALVAAVCAAPDDDAPALVIADYFDEIGQDKRAEFVRLQVKLFRTPRCGHILQDPKGCAEYCAPWRRAADLLAAHWREWTAIPGMAKETRYFYRRGFVHVVQCSAADWLAHGDELVAAHPVTEVRLATLPTAHVPAFNALRPWKKPLEWGGDMVWSFETEWPTVKTWHLPAMPQPVAAGAYALGQALAARRDGQFLQAFFDADRGAPAMPDRRAFIRPPSTD